MDWDVFNSFEDDEFEVTPLNAAMRKIIANIIEIFQKMDDHLSRNENSQFDNNLDFVMNRLSEVCFLARAEDDPDLSEEEIERLLAEAEQKSTEIDFDALFNPENESAKSSMDVIGYMKKDDEDPFDL